jgi:4-amino-4-deoxy-L-arabinose transferase-like glycosyltransferase
VRTCSRAALKLASGSHILGNRRNFADLFALEILEVVYIPVTSENMHLEVPAVYNTLFYNPFFSSFYIAMPDLTMQSRNFLLKDFLSLTLGLCLIFGVFLGARPLMVPDEGRYAEIPREMVESGDYLTPHLNYIKYFEKPALFYWLEAASIKVFGLNEWALRGVVALVSLLGCLMVYIAGLKLYDRRTGILACLILATGALYFSMSRFVITDMPLTVCLTVGLLLFILGTQESSRKKQRYYFWGMYVSAALAVLIKGLVGAVFPGLIILVWLAITREWQQLKNYCLLTGAGLFLLIAAPWHILIQLKNPEFFQFYFIDQHFLRYLTDYAGRRQAIWFFPAVTLGGFFPWVCFLLIPFLRGGAAFLLFAAKKFRERFFYARASSNVLPNPPRTPLLQRGELLLHKPTLFFILWAAVLFIFFSLSKSQLLSYALPIMPPLALLMARYFALHWQERHNRAIAAGFFLVAGLGVLISIGAVIALHDRSMPLFVYVAITLLLIGTLSSAIVYWCMGIQKALIILILTCSSCFVMGDVAYPSIDTRSLKPLILTLKAKLTPDSEVVSYHEYYQDLPVYLARRVTVVSYKGELEFGTRHQDTREWMLDEQSFWQRWRNKPGMFMIMGIDDYAVLKKQKIVPLYLISQTPQDVLLTNSR